MTVGNSSSMMSSYASQISNNRNTYPQNSAKNSEVQSSDGSSFDAITQMLMSALDTNNTATIDKSEFTQAAKILAKNESSENVDNAFNKIDTNGDEVISSNEFINALKEAREAKVELKQHIDMNALDSALSTEQINKLTKLHSSADEAQKSLFNKVTAAYASVAPTTGMTTNISV